jgi:hypothetical protein
MKYYRTKQTFLLSLWIAVCLVWPWFSAAATLHAILAGNTLDDYIGPAVTQDLEQFRRELQTIAETTEMLVRRVELTGTQLRKNALMDTISGLQPGSDDVVLFYFSGHGFSLQTKDKWPYMAMLNDEALDEKWVFDTLAATQPRLLLVISDSCNNVIPEAYAPDVSVERRFKRSGDVRENYRALFLHARGAILASSSQHNEVSSTLRNGSAFTRQFFSALHDAVAQSRQSTWKDVMDAAIRPIWIEGQYQHPQYVEMPIEVGLAQATPTMPIPPTATPTPILWRIPDINVPDLPTPEPTPTPTPTPQPIPTPNFTPEPTPFEPLHEEPASEYPGQFVCEHAETVLNIELYGSDNLLRFVVAADEGLTGKYTLRDRLKEFTVYLAPGKRATVYLRGERNEMLIPHDLSLCVYYEDMGVNNTVFIKED